LSYKPGTHNNVATPMKIKN